MKVKSCLLISVLITAMLSCNALAYEETDIADSEELLTKESVSGPYTDTADDLSDVYYEDMTASVMEDSDIDDALNQDEMLTKINVYDASTDNYGYEYNYLSSYYYAEDGAEENYPSEFAISEFEVSTYVGESTTLSLSMSANYSLTLVSEDDTIATANVTGTSTSITSSGISYGRTITIYGNGEGTTSININSGNSTIGVIYVTVGVKTENLGKQHVLSTVQTEVTSTYEQNYYVDCDAVSISSSSVSKKTSSTSINGVTTSTTSYTTTLTLSLNEIGNWNFNVYGEETGRMKNFNVSIADHIWNSDYTVDVEPTTTSEGSKSIHCSVCNEINPDTVTSIPMKEKTNISTCKITIEDSQCIYSGDPQTPDLIITDNGTKLSVNDYTVTYSDNINAGVATAVISACGNDYTGSVTISFTISPKNIENCVLTLSESSFEYDGTAKTPDVTVTDGAYTLQEGNEYSVSYSNNIKAGSAMVTVTGIGNYSGTISHSFSIENVEQENLEDTDNSSSSSSSNVSGRGSSSSSGSSTSSENSGSSSSSNSGSISESRSSSGSTSSENSNSSASSSSLSTTNIVNCQITLSQTTYYYDGTEKTPSVTVTYGSSTLKNGKDFTVSYSHNKKIGKAKVTVTGIGNYTGTAKSSFKITVEKGASYTVGDFNVSITHASSKGNGRVKITGLNNASLTDVKIPAYVTIGGSKFRVNAISAKAFKGNSNLQTVKVGSNVKRIGRAAFRGCKNLSKVTIGENVKTIGKRAFYHCRNLKTINVKSEVLSSIGSDAFKGIKSSASISVPSSKLSSYQTLLSGNGQSDQVKIIAK